MGTREVARINGMLGGRPEGSKNRLTILKEKKRIQIEKSITRMANKLTNAQAIVALGTHKMVRMYKGEDGKIHTETIRDEQRMQNLLDNGEYGIDYVIVVGKEPEWKAANALLDRTFGKATETVKMSGDIAFSLKGLAQVRQEIKDEPLQISSETVEEDEL